MGKNFSHWTIQICQNQDFISSPLSRKNTITTSNNCSIFARKQGRVINQRVRIKNWQNFVNLFKHFGSNIFQFYSYISQRTFQKNFNSIFKFGCFSWYYAYISKKKCVSYLIQNLILERLAPVSNPKNEKAKSLYAIF